MNLYKSRNFDGHLESYRCPLTDCFDEGSLLDSNLMHDRNRSVTHFYLQTDVGPRIISDVEIAFSPDPSVSCNFSREYREKLAARIISTHSPNGMTDEILSDALPSNASMERFESSRISEQYLDVLKQTSLDNELSSTPSSSQSQSESQESDSTSD